LLRKEKVVHASLEYFIQKGSNSVNLSEGNTGNDLSFEIARLADINSIDINLFNRPVIWWFPSQPIIYDKGLVSKKMTGCLFCTGE